MPSAKKFRLRKLTYYDRLLALAFNSKYCTEYNRLFGAKNRTVNLFSLQSGEQREAFKKRWGLNFIVDPEEVKNRPENQLNKNMEGGIFSDYTATLKVVSGETILEGERLNFSRDLEQGKYLTLRMDVTTDKGKLLKDIEGYIDFYRRVAKVHLGTRAKPSAGLGKFDHWDIYRLHHVEKKSLLQIAKDLAGEQGSRKDAAHNKIINAKRDQIRRAYRKAEEMVSQIQPLSKQLPIQDCSVLPHYCK